MPISKDEKIDSIKRQVEFSISSLYMMRGARMGVYLFQRYLLCTYSLSGPVVDIRDVGRFENWVIGI